MRVTFLYLLFLLCCVSLQAQVGVGTTSPDTSSILDVSSTEKGFLLPRLDSSSRVSIVGPATGLLVYDTTTNKIYLYTGQNWVAVLSKES